MRLCRVWALAAAVSFAYGCDDKPKTTTPDAAAAAATPPPTPPPPPKAPPIAVEPGFFLVAGERVQPSDPDPVGQIASLLTGKPLVEGAIVEMDVRRAAKPSQVVTMIAALRRAKARGAVARTENRDKVIQPFAITFASPPRPECSVVAYIGKDSRINVWPIGGGAAKSYSRGFAGPDMTLGSEGVRESVGRCESPILFVGADDAMSWGLVYDIATISKSGAGAMAKITDFAVVPSTVVPGRRVALE